MAQAVFLGVALLVLAAIHTYLWLRLVRSTTRRGSARRIGTWLLIGMAGVLVLSLIGSRAFPHDVAAALAWPGYLWLAVLFYLVLFLALLEVPALIARFLLRRRRTAEDRQPGHDGAGSSQDGPSPNPDAPRTAGAADPQRRLFLARTVAITAGVAASGLVASGVSTAMGPPGLKRIDIPLAKLPASADGLRIALVSDIHLGPLLGYAHTRRIVDMINGLDADVVAVVGDLVDGSVAELGQAASPLQDLRSRLGAYFVTGNHEYFSGYQEWVDEVASLGVRPLRNERVQVAGIDLAGINDSTGRSFGDRPDLGKALAGRDQARLVVLLAHQPAQAREAAAAGVDLQLSGHTHGGQLAPFGVIVRASGQPILSGYGEVDGMPVYVTNGAGFWGPPVRIGAPPDITLVRLHRP